MRELITIRGLHLLLPLLLCMAFASPALAQAPAAPVAAPTAPVALGAASAPAKESPVCTNFSNRKSEIFGGSFSAGNSNSAGTNANASGLLSEIEAYIKDVVSTATFKLFSAFTSNTTYRNAVFASMVLMVLFYGVGFTIGVVQASFGQVLIRLVKITIIATLVSPAGWSFFSQFVVRFFSDGTDDIIRGMMQIGTGTAAPPGASPFFQLDRLTSFLITPESIIAIMGSAVKGGPFGLTMSAMLLLSFWTFIKLILKALQVYAVTYVARALILGVAPIFFVFMLFSQTMNYFKSWVNTLLNLSLQPILLFTFLSFFIVLIESASKDMLGFELCWSETKLIEGAENKQSFWTFVKPGTSEPISKGDMTWQGSLDCLADGSKKCPSFPINILDILTFLILIYLAERFIDVLQQMSSELSNAFVNVDAGGKFQEFIARAGQKSEGGGPGSVSAGGATTAPGGGAVQGNRSGAAGGGNGRPTGGSTGAPSGAPPKPVSTPAKPDDTKPKT